MHTLTVRTERKTQFVDITADLRDAVGGEQGRLVSVFIPHTTAGIVLQASGDGARTVAADVETALDAMVDESLPWQHVAEGDRNPWSHIRAALTASSVSIPLVGGDLVLGDHQAVFLAEFDGPRERTVHVVVCP